MKKVFFTLVAISFLTFSTVLSQNDNGLIGRARGAAADCLNDYNGNNWIVSSSVNIVGSCFAGGFITEVSFSARPVSLPCGEEGCPPPALPIIIASVQFGCGGEIISNSCY